MTDRLDILMRLECGWTWKNSSNSRQFIDSTRILFRRDSLAPDMFQDMDVAWFLEEKKLEDQNNITYDLMELTQLIFGKSVAFTLKNAKIIYIYNHSELGVLRIGDMVDNPWTGPFGMSGDTLIISPRSPLFIADFTTGWSVDASSRNLKLSASGGPVLYDIAILGTSPQWVDSYHSVSDFSENDSYPADPPNHGDSYPADPPGNGSSG
jgi:hypothetical protein